MASAIITVQWEQVVCLHQNGHIRSYSVQYGIQGSNFSNTLNVSGGGTTETIISDLNSATNYSIEVAAVNSAGIGVFSTAIYAITLGIIFMHYLTLLVGILVHIKGLNIKCPVCHETRNMSSLVFSSFTDT